jgi:hypothetical protein
MDLGTDARCLRIILREPPRQGAYQFPVYIEAEYIKARQATFFKAGAVVFDSAILRRIVHWELEYSI